jgi:hypothetical protein
VEWKIYHINYLQTCVGASHMSQKCYNEVKITETMCNERFFLFPCAQYILNLLVDYLIHSQLFAFSFCVCFYNVVICEQ